MIIRALFILLFIGVVLVLIPRYRRYGLIICGAVAALMLGTGIYEAIQVPAVDAPAPLTSAANSSASISKPRAHIVTMQLEGRGAPWRLHGRVENQSALPIRSLRVNIERHDCPSSDAALSACTLIWQGERVLHVSIPAQATGNVDESFYSHGAVPRHKGQLRDLIEITDVN